MNLLMKLFVFSFSCFSTNLQIDDKKKLFLILCFCLHFFNLFHAQILCIFPKLVFLSFLICLFYVSFPLCFLSNLSNRFVFGFGTIFVKDVKVLNVAKMEKMEHRVHRRHQHHRHQIHQLRPRRLQAVMKKQIHRRQQHQIQLLLCQVVMLSLQAILLLHQPLLRQHQSQVQ